MTVNDIRDNIVRSLYPEGVNEAFDSGISEECINAFIDIVRSKKPFNNAENITSNLKAANVPEIDILKMSLIATTPGFSKIVDFSATSTDKEVFIITCFERTGLLKPVIISYLSYFYLANGQSFSKEYPLLSSKSAKELTASEEILNKYTVSGVPEAYRIKGKALNDFVVDGQVDAEGSAAANVTHASDLGDSLSYLEMARACFNSGPSLWEKSYRYYASCSSAAMNSEDKDNWTSLYYYAQYNGSLIVQGAILFVITLILTLFIPSFTYFEGQTVFGIICLVLQAIILAFSIITHKNRPHVNLSGFIMIVFILMMSFVIARIMF